MRHYGVVQRNPGVYNHIARNMLGQLNARMLTTNQKYGSWTRQLQDGTEISVQIIKNGLVPLYRVHVVPALLAPTDQVKPYTMFLESGAYRVQLLDSIYTARYLVGDEIKAQYTPLVEWDGKAGLTDDDIVCPLQTIKLPVPADAPPAPFTGSLDPTTYETANSLRGTDQPGYRAASLLPASSYSGKARLYVQALYGSNRDDVYVNYYGGTYEWPKLNIYSPDGSGSFGFGFQYVQCPVLVTSPDYRYFLVSFNTTSFPAGGVAAPMIVRELVPYVSPTSDEYDNVLAEIQTLRKTLQDKYTGYHDKPKSEQPAQCSITEGTLLSLLAPSVTSRTFTTVMPPDGGIPFGTPFAYGWKPTWGGYRWHMAVTYASALDYADAGRELEVNLTLTESVTDGWDISAVVTAGPVVTSSVRGDGAGYGQYDFYMWQPLGFPYDAFFLDWTFNKCSLVGAPPGIIVDAPFFFDDFPVYGIMGDDDVWVPVTVTVEDRGFTYKPEGASGWVKPNFCVPGKITQQLRDMPSKPEKATIVKVGGNVTIGITHLSQDESVSITTMQSGASGWYDHTLWSPFADQGACGGSPYDSIVSDDGEPWREGLGLYNELCMYGTAGIFDWEEDHLNAPSFSVNTMLAVPPCNSELIFTGRSQFNNSGTRSHHYQETYAPQPSDTDYTQLSEYPILVTEVSMFYSYGGDRCRPEYYHWSGSWANPRSSNYSSGQWGSGNPVITESLWCDYNTHQKVWVHSPLEVGRLVYDQANGGSGDIVQMEQHAAQMAETEYRLNGNHSTNDPNPDFDLELATFFQPPFGACIGNRNIGNLTTIVQVSAIFNSVTVSGTSILAQLLEDDASPGYDTETVSSFVGWS